MGYRLGGSIEPQWYTLSGFVDEEKPPRVKLKPLRGLALDTAMEGARISGDNLLLTARGVDAALQSGVVDWENFEDDDGAVDSKFKRSKLADMSYLRRQEIAAEIISISRISDEERKN